MKPKLSDTSKMPGKSWGLPAWETCPGARGPDGRPVAACARCYALTGAYQFPSTIAARAHNLADWKRSEWVADMVAVIGRLGKPFFRWFDSGDCYTPALAIKIGEVCQATPHVRHWIPSRSYKVPDIKVELDRVGRLPNVVVRWSSDSTNGKRLWGSGRNSTIIQTSEDFRPAKGYSLCRAGERGGACGPCRACWSEVKTVAYVAHGNAVSPKKFDKPLTV